MDGNTAYTPGTTIQTLVENTDDLSRLDLFLAQKFSHYSRTFFKELINKGFIMINDKPVSKASIQLKKGTIITISFPEIILPNISEQSVSHIPVHVIYQNEHFIIIDKPAHITVHSPGKGHTELTLVDWLVNYFHEIKSVGSAERPGIVHRLDKDTSGLMIIARNNHAHAKLSDMFKNRHIHKTYLAVVDRHPLQTGSINFNITRHPTNRVKMTHSAIQGRDASTNYRVQTYFKETALIEAMPLTGRTHQIRVHCAAIGHPLIGDALYGSSSKLINRQALHAYRLSFTFEGQEYNFVQQPPQDFQNLLHTLS